MYDKNLPKHFYDEESAREYMEKLRWPDGPACPHCGSVAFYRLKAKIGSKSPVRAGVLKCKDCRRQYTVLVGTIFSDSHIPIHKWLYAISMLCASKKGVSAHQLHRQLRITYKSAWFMAHRIRYSMTQSPLKEKLNGIVEVDETYIGGRARIERKSDNKIPVVALVERGGRVHATPFITVTAATINRQMAKSVAEEAHIMTDSSALYRDVKDSFAKHEKVNHSEYEYVRGNVHTNTIEGYFGLLKRGLNGIYQHVSKHHLHRYLDEFCFRYNNRSISDGERTNIAIQAAEGKRLTYKNSLAGA